MPLWLHITTKLRSAVMNLASVLQTTESIPSHLICFSQSMEFFVLRDAIIKPQHRYSVKFTKNMAFLPHLQIFQTIFKQATVFSQTLSSQYSSIRQNSFIWSYQTTLDCNQFKTNLWVHYVPTRMQGWARNSGHRIAVIYLQVPQMWAISWTVVRELPKYGSTEQDCAVIIF
jgi:hypothetical protein